MQSISNYSHVSQEQQKSMSRIHQTPDRTAAVLFKGAVFYGGNFTININCLNVRNVSYIIWNIVPKSWGDVRKSSVTICLCM